MQKYRFKNPELLTSAPKPGDCILMDTGGNSIHLMELETGTSGKGLFISPEPYTFGHGAGSRGCFLKNESVFLPQDRCLVIDRHVFNDLRSVTYTFLKNSAMDIERARPSEETYPRTRVYESGAFTWLASFDPFVLEGGKRCSGIKLAPWCFEHMRECRINKERFEAAEGVESRVLEDLVASFDKLWEYCLFALKDYLERIDDPMPEYSF